MNIAFDFDGTLLDSRPRHVEALRCVWPEVDNKLADGWVSRFWQCKLSGRSTKDFLVAERVEGAEGVACDWIEMIEDDYMMAHDQVYLDTRNTLEVLCHSHRLFLATARGNSERAFGQIKQFSLERFFEQVHVVAPGRDAGLRKTQSLSDITVDCVIGDTESDADWAASCGAQFVPVSWGFREKQFWIDRGMNPVSTHAELIQTLNVI